MKRNPLYGGSSWSKPLGGAKRIASPRAKAEEPPARAPAPTLRQRLGLGWRKVLARRWSALMASSLAVAMIAFITYSALHPAHVYTQADIDAAVAYSLKHRPADPSPASVAAEIIRPSVVRVVGYGAEPTAPGLVLPGQAKAKGKNQQGVVVPEQGAKPMQPEAEQGAISVGSGVVIDDKGTILTNWHVADSAPVLRVTFSNGLESEADVVGAQPDDDLAIIRARVLPDDLKPATLVSTKNLRPGDQVVAVGFPFAIGPSVSAGVVSGLKREWVLSDKRSMTNLIQFDAAANPGNSGGPLVNRDGEVLGIVTGILNPTEQHVFIGIGFAVPIENAAKAAGMSPF